MTTGFTFICIYLLQVTYQLKILTTAFFAVIVLKKRLIKWQWCALALLAAGVALVQLSPGQEQKSTKNADEQSRILGFGAALAACFISGFAGIYFEKVLKGSNISVRAHFFSFCFNFRLIDTFCTGYKLGPRSLASQASACDVICFKYATFFLF